MACSHIVQEASNKKNKLILEKKKYTDAVAKLETAKSIVDGYRAYFAKVSAYLQYIIVNFKPFQQEGCNAQISKLEGVISQLDALIQDIQSAVEEIQDEINEQTAIIRSSRQCSSCAAAAAAARRKEEQKQEYEATGTISRRAGGGPVSVEFKEMKY